MWLWIFQYQYSSLHIISDNCKRRYAGFVFNFIIYNIFLLITHILHHNSGFRQKTTITIVPKQNLKEIHIVAKP